MNRRQLLGVIAGWGLSLAGCVGQDSAPAQPTDSPTPSPTAGSESHVDVPLCPERPGLFTREKVVRYATQFETAFVTRRTLREQEGITSITVDVSEDSTEVRQSDDGWVVRFQVVGPAYRYRPTPGSTKTAHVDPPLYTANYLITDEQVFRAQAVEAVDPRENGTMVQCPPE